MKIIGVVLFFVLFSCAANAACPSTLLLKDANNVTAPGKYIDDGSGNCQVAIDTSASGNLINAIKSPPGLGTTGGWTPVVKTGIVGTVLSIKASAGWLGLAQCDNNNSVWSYLQIFNLATGSVTLGITVPVQIVPIAPNSSNGFVANLVGMQYGTAISIAATTTATGATPVATGLNCTFGFN